MLELADIVLRPLLYAALVALVFVPLEKIAPLRATRRTRFRTDLLFATLGAVLTQAALFGVAGALLSVADAIGADGPLGALPAWIAIPCGLLYFELAGYAYHRLAHSSGTLYRLHEVHHSSTTMDWLAGFRQHPIEIALMTLVQNAPLVLLGLPLGEHALLVLVLRLNTLFVHSNLLTPSWLGALVATPAFHHRHHDRDADTANYATLFPWIDRLFRTHASESAAVFGVPGDRDDGGFVALLLAPFRRRRA